MLERLGEWLALGGPVLTLLLVLSIVTLAIVLVKLYQYLVLGRAGNRFIPGVMEAYRQGYFEDALESLSRQRSPVAKVMAVAVEGYAREDVDESVVREETTRVANEYLQDMRSYLRGLEVIGTLSPLLGLLGTVLGMIDAFQQMEIAGSRVNPSVLSGGIWEALLTTAAGLVVAIPALTMLNFFERVVQRTAHDMEDAATQVFTWSLTTPNTPFRSNSKIKLGAIFKK